MFLDSKKLLKGIKRGNHNDYRSYYDLHYGVFCQFANRFLQDYESSRDIVQEAFIAAWNNRDRFKDLDHMKSYLYKTIHNRCLNHIRNSKVEAKNLDEIQYLGSEGYFKNVLIEEEVYKHICMQIEQLPEMQRQVIEMHIEGMSNGEMAENLNVGINTIRTHKQRAKSTLKSQLRGILGLLLLTLVV